MDTKDIMVWTGLFSDMCYDIEKVMEYKFHSNV